MSDEQEDSFHVDDVTLNAKDGGTEIHSQHTLDDSASAPPDSKQPLAEPLALMLNSLPELQHEAVRLRHLERWPLEAIANRLGKTPVDVAGLLHQAMCALRDQLPNEPKD